LSGNYAFHLMAYRRELLLELGGLRPEFDGSQDYDLLLRAAETHPVVRHIPAVLYHWRQHETSVAHSDDAKSYAFEAGTRALNQALSRRGLAAEALEIDDLWRGMHVIRWRPVRAAEITVVQVQSGDTGSYRAAFENHDLETPYLAVLASTLTELAPDALTGLCAWLTVPGVGLASGKLLDSEGHIEYAGMVYQDGSPIIPYRGYPESEAGYLAMTRIVHNISAPHPYCVLIHRELWRRLNGLDCRYTGPYALLDFALRALDSGWRAVVDPQYRWRMPSSLPIAAGEDLSLFGRRWRKRLAEGDRYGNPNWRVTDSGVRLSE
ncbi:MAG: hypothetical protein RQ715_11900, partial [Methylococcales bacterium]|nr:hypothetical protein [Methylococcales bacterium]